MFTIKHVTAEGNEELHYGSNPLFVSADSAEGKQRGNAIVHYTNANQKVCDIRWGKVYVMNELGKTVATYDLGSHPGASSVGSFQAGLGLQNPGLQNRA